MSEELAVEECIVFLRPSAGPWERAVVLPKHLVSSFQIPDLHLVVANLGNFQGENFCLTSQWTFNVSGREMLKGKKVGP